MNSSLNTNVVLRWLSESFVRTPQSITRTLHLTAPVQLHCLTGSRNYLLFCKSSLIPFMNKLQMPPHISIIYFSVLYFVPCQISTLQLNQSSNFCGYNWRKDVSSKNLEKVNENCFMKTNYIFFRVWWKVFLFWLSFCFSVWNNTVVSGWWSPINCPI